MKGTNKPTNNKRKGRLHNLLSQRFVNSFPAAHCNTWMIYFLSTIAVSLDSWKFVSLNIVMGFINLRNTKRNVQFNNKISSACRIDGFI